MSWKCKLGFHDYVEVRAENLSDNFSNWLLANYGPVASTMAVDILAKYFDRWVGGKRYTAKVCIRCEKCVDEISKLEDTFSYDIIYDKYTNEGSRTKLAKKIYKEKYNGTG
jgi:hypothetical protein